MPFYLFATVPKGPGDKPTIYEIEQRMSDRPLTTHPATGEPIRRIIASQYSILRSMRRGTGTNKACGPGCC